MANWEILPVVAAREGLTFTAIVREPNNPLVRQSLAKLRGVGGGERIGLQRVEPERRDELDI